MNAASVDTLPRVDGVADGLPHPLKFTGVTTPNSNEHKPMRRIPFLAFLLISCAAGPANAQVSDAAVDSTRISQDISPTAPGTVFGVVSDGETGKALPYTNIVYVKILPTGEEEQFGGTMAVGPGQYWATLPPGRYKFNFLYLGYEKYETEAFNLGPAQQIDLSVAMKVKPIEMAMIAIQATAITNTEFAQLERQRKAVAVQDALSAEQISKSTDSNVAEALERVTGLSVVGGKFVFVRGLGDRYSSTSLNGASLSSPEPNRRTVPLDIFPSAMLDNVVVQKAYTPDMPGEFGGGNIDVRTREAIDKRQLTVSIKGGVSTNVLDNGYQSYQGGELDWLGRDDGTRALPSMLDPYVDTKLPGKKSPFRPGEGLEVTELSAIRESFSNTWTPREFRSPVNSSYSLMYADGFSVGGRDGSVLLAGSLSNTFNSRIYDEYDFRNGSIESGVISPRTAGEVQQSDAETLLGITGALNFRPTSWSNISYNYLHTRGSEDKARSAQGVDDQGETVLQHSLTFIERQLDSHVLQANMAVGPAGSNLHWLGSYSAAERDEPDRRYSEFRWIEETIYNNDDEPIGTDGYWGGSALAYPFQRVFGQSEEDDQGAKVNYDWRLPATSFSQQGLKVGWEIRDRNRSTSYRRFGIKSQGLDYHVGEGQGERVFDRSLYEDPEALDRVIIEETTRPSDSYDSGQQVTGYFAMADFDIADKVRIVGGARFEDSRQYVNVVPTNVAEDEAEVRQIRLDRENVLPAVNGTWRMTERSNFRLGYSKTINRPEMRELSPFQNFNYETNLEEQGNAYLDQAVIDSYDARIEAFPGIRRYVAVSGFYKDFSLPIERILLPLAAGNLKEVPGNGNTGELYGVELEWRGSVSNAARTVGQVGVGTAWLLTRPFWALGKVPGLGQVGNLAYSWRTVPDSDPRAIRNFGLTANYSRIFSETLVNRDLVGRQAQMTISPDSDLPLEALEDDNYATGPLTGQSTYALNLGVFYGDGSRDASLMLKDFGDRLYAYGVGIQQDIYERVPASLDFSFIQRFGGLRVKLSAENLLNRKREFAYDKGGEFEFEDGEGNPVDDPIRRSWYDGRKFAISFSWSL